ncbi:unnamed protein product [Fusarium graminearum]|nr:unnamed protein product [Fusarium graminearum]
MPYDSWCYMLLLSACSMARQVKPLQQFTPCTCRAGHRKYPKHYIRASCPGFGVKRYCCC